MRWGIRAGVGWPGATPVPVPVPACACQCLPMPVCACACLECLLCSQDRAATSKEPVLRLAKVPKHPGTPGPGLGLNRAKLYFPQHRHLQIYRRQPSSSTQLSPTQLSPPLHHPGWAQTKPWPNRRQTTCASCKATPKMPTSRTKLKTSDF